MRPLVRHLRVPVLLMILLPVFAICLLCYTFQDGVITDTPFGIVDQDHSSISRMLVKNITENETFDVQFYSDSPQELQTLIETNQVIAGIIIPPNFSVDVTAGKSPSVMIVYDGCQMSVVGISKVKLTEVLTTLKVGASIQILEGKLNLQPDEALMYAQPISNTFRYLGNPEKSIADYVIPGSIANIVQLTLYMFMVEAIRREDGEWVHPLLYNLFGTVLSTAVLLLCIWIAHALFQMPMNGSFVTIAILGALNMFIIGNVSAMIRLLVPIKMLAVQFGTIVMATLLFSGYTFPALGMPPLFQTIAAFLPFTYFSIPLRDVMLLGSSTATVIRSIHWLANAAVITTIPVLVCWLWYRFRLRKPVESNGQTPIEHTEEKQATHIDSTVAESQLEQGVPPVC